MAATIGERTRWAREQADISGRELARLAGLSPNHVGLIEAGGDRGVNVSTLTAIARVLGVSLDWLATGQGAEPTALGIKRAVTKFRSANPTAA